MTPEEQWALINVSTFDQAVFTKIKSVRTAMANAEIEADEIRTNVQGVPLKFSEEGEFLSISVGTDSSGKPQVPMKIPSVWLEA
jgi:hypothetical protein